MISSQKVIFITGSSSGFGRSITEKALAEGYNVVATARNTDTLTSLVEQYTSNILVLELDVTNPEQIKQAVATAVDHFGKIDVLINNAGIGYFASVEESIEEQTRKMFEINFWGLMNATNAVLPFMRNQQSGHIINLSSIGGLTSFPTLGYYHATKYAVEGISESLAQEVSPFHIHVTLIEPSSFRTDWGGRSSVKTKPTISTYQETLSPMLDHMEQASGQEPGDPEKAALAILKVIESDNPPLRLLLGKAAYQAATHKFTNLLQTIEDWKETTINADFAE
ncbi:oxidoreductase [Paenibacillus kyungheensis]